MKKSGVFVRLTPSIVTMTVEDLRRKEESEELISILTSDETAEEKEKAIRKLKEEHESKYKNSNLKLIRREYSRMKYFYVFEGKKAYLASSDVVCLPSFDLKDEPLTDLTYFIYFSEKISRNAVINGFDVQVLYRLEDQYIISRNGSYSIAVDDGNLEIKYGSKVEYTPKAEDICKSITRLVKKYKPVEMKKNKR